MEKQREQPTARSDDRAEAEPEGERVARTRCPFCREDALSTQAAVACEACLARHHAACWSESGSCGACGHRTPLIRAAPRPRRARAVMGALVLLLLGAGLGRFTADRSGTRSEGASAPVTAPPAEAPRTPGWERARATRRATDAVLRRLGIVLEDMVVESVRAGTPAHGLVPEQWAIESVNGVPVEDVIELGDALAIHPEGARVRLGVRGLLIHRNESKVVEVVLGPQPTKLPD